VLLYYYYGNKRSRVLQSIPMPLFSVAFIWTRRN